MRRLASSRRHRPIALVSAGLIGLGALCIVAGARSLAAPAAGTAVPRLHATTQDARAASDVTVPARSAPTRQSQGRPQGTDSNRPHGLAGARPSAPADEGAGWSLPVAPPVAIEIPRLDVRSALVELDLHVNHRLEVPEDPQVAGWFIRGARPGENGPAVIAGHIDSYRGPGIFWRLAELTAGDSIVIRRADGTDAKFIVDRVERWPKEDFPTEQVYRSHEGATLRLITCGGTFDTATRSYRDNVIVFADLSDEHPAGG